MNIIAPLFYQCHYNAHVAALCVPGTPDTLVSYGRLARLINNASRKALQLGLAPGQVVAIFVNNPILHTVITLGLLRLGVVTFSGRNPELPRELRVDALITDSFFPYRAARIIHADMAWTEGDGSPLDPAQLTPTNPDDICRIILTSGTTGEGKAVALSHRMMAERIARHQFIFGARLLPCSRTYCDMGFATSLGFQFLIYMLGRGGTLFLPGLSADHIVRAFEAYQVQNVITSPAGLASYLGYFEGQPKLKCNLEMIFTGGSLLSAALANRARARMCSHIVAGYGATETSMVAAAPAQVIAGTPNAVGYVMPDLSVEIVDEAGRVLPTGAEGLVRIKGPYNAARYLGDTDQSPFRGEWFHPNDFGRLTDEQLLVILGREKSVMNLGGDKIRPETVEEVMKTYPGLEDAGVFSITNELGIEEIWSVVVVQGPWDEQRLRAHCESKLPPTFVPGRIIKVDSLPKNAMGKIERRALPDLARAKLN